MITDVVVKLVCFDLGGVLVRLVDGLQDACRGAGVAYRPWTETAAERAAWDAANRNHESGAVDDRQYFRRMAGILPYDERGVERLFDAWLRGLYPGAAELLNAVRRAGYATACLSNTNARHWQILTAAAGPYTPLRQLDWAFASHLIGAPKPAPETYRHVEDATGAAGASVLFFDDSEVNCRAAAARGWIAHHIHPGPDPPRQVRAELHRRGVL